MIFRWTAKVLPPSAISVAEFYDFFAPLKSKLPDIRELLGHKSRIGIAVSGGVDSMALAALCSDLMTYPPAKQLYDFQFTPFIVDHKARQGSSEEAERVQKRLRNLGFDPHIRSLTWPDSVSPLDLTDFETQARGLRYQALGGACRDLNIRHLLLAHHNDDQAETVLMRLASGHKSHALKGIQSRANIPECWGIHGVGKSGVWEKLLSSSLKEEEINPSSLEARKLREKLAQRDIFEGGGIDILRPLLDFDKGRLIETCRARGLLWEEDKTNDDVWRSPRNNVRALLRSAKLPQALQKNSLLQVAERTDRVFRVSNAFAMEALSGCEVLLFDVRCGGLVVRFPRTIKLFRQDNEWSTRRRARFVAAMVLKKFAMAVTPLEEIPLQSLEQATLSIFPDLSDRHTAADGSLQATCFTGGGVQFQRLHLPLAVPRLELDQTISGTSKDLDPLFVWKLTRQPFAKAPLSFTVQPALNEVYSHAENVSSWSSWQLWDGRYWIRLINTSHRPVIVRSFQPSDLQYLRSILTHQRYKDFHQSLHFIAPGKVRWTLLAIAIIETDSSSIGRLLALPSLGQAGTFAIDEEGGTNKVHWQIRYKFANLGYRFADTAVKRITRRNTRIRIKRNANLTISWHD